MFTNFLFVPRSETRRSKHCPLPLKKRRKLNRSPRLRHRETLRGLAALSASLLTQNLADCMQSSTSVVLSCSPRHKVTETLLWLCVDVRVLLTVLDGLVLLARAELTKLKTQLEVPGSTGSLTNAVDRKLEDGQRVSYSCTIRNAPLCLLHVSLLRLKFWLFPTEPAPASLGSAEARGGPAVRWTSLLSQHRRGKAASGISNCRWDTSQTGITADM